MNIDNYTVFDVETANSNRDSICSIGIVSVRNNEVVFEEEFLVNPECEFSSINVSVHGITAEKVATAPVFPEIWDSISRFFTESVLIAHNAKSMDLCALCKTLDKYGLAVPKIDYICTYEEARKFIPVENCDSYKLTDLCNYYGISLCSHHNALNDAIACKKIFEHLYSCHLGEIFPKPYNYSGGNSDSSCSSSRYSIYSEKTITMQELERIVKSIIEDKEVTVREAERLLAWMKGQQSLKGCYPYDKIFSILNTVLSDSQIDNQEKITLLEALDGFIHPKISNSKIDLKGKTVCLSGEFLFGSKKEVEQHLIKLGAVVMPSLTKKVEVLILGGCGNALWKHENYGGKYEKAMQYNEKGASIEVYKETDVLEV